MKIDEIPEGLRTPYVFMCQCGQCHHILTQKDDFPEYETEIYYLCDCGEYVEFILPVN